MPTKTCKNCGMLVGVRQRVCPKCKHQLHTEENPQRFASAMTAVKKLGGVAAARVVLAEVMRIDKEIRMAGFSSWHQLKAVLDGLNDLKAMLKEEE